MGNSRPRWRLQVLDDVVQPLDLISHDNHGSAHEPDGIEQCLRRVSGRSCLIHESRESVFAVIGEVTKDPFIKDLARLAHVYRGLRKFIGHTIVIRHLSMMTLSKAASTRNERK